MKTKRFDFNYKPLQIDVSMSVSGSVPGKQNYNADADEFTPDYTLTNLIIQPYVSRMDKDEILPAGRINQNLANIKWYEIISGTRTQILAENTNYEITTSAIIYTGGAYPAVEMPSYLYAGHPFKKENKQCRNNY